ncbi:APC family permease [Kineococcus rhizosphaerae]|uniref:Amino acid/polyamine/organocation transporter (APC superfamily) n=1 Tax=Kineococcus rhizosphaerae TaxID=559628 RepID=A0A2T0R9J0_9ACTN|nr:APC family permease [Kineococcus rhizosphaerae]PRY17810.1 amino acid/polyamine/organocation transporter (APC superfamily) [Kineococcus rhizosphaerae]
MSEPPPTARHEGSTAAAAAPGTSETRLRGGAVGLGGAVVMSAALMGPAVSVYFNPQLVAGFAGAAMPLVMAASLIASLVVANGVAAMSRELPSAGAFYTYVSRGIGPRTGFVTGILMFLSYALLVPAELALIGVYAHDVLDGYGLSLPWPVISLFFAALMLALSWRGIAGSLKTALTLFSVEVAVIVVLSVVVLLKGGAQGITAAPFLPSSSPDGLSGLALGMVFGVLSFVGFESAATLGEEVREPRRNVPRGIFGAVLLVGVIYLFTTYAEMIGFGTDGVDALTSDTAPITTLARQYAPWLELLVGLAGISSIFAVVMNSHNGITRIVFAMGRERMLPERLARVHPRHGTPSTAIVANTVFAVAVTLVVGLAVGPFETYAYLGSLLTLAIIPVYVLTNVACVRFFATTARARRRTVPHVVLPVLGVLVMLIPVYGLLWPVPAAPYNAFPYVVLATVVMSAAVAAVIGRRRPEVLARAGAVLAAGEVDDATARTPDATERSRG